MDNSTDTKWADVLMHTMAVAVADAANHGLFDNLLIVMSPDTYRRLETSGIMFMQDCISECAILYGIPVETSPKIEDGRAALVHKETLFEYTPEMERYYSILARG